MIQSMTGFGRGEAANEKYKVTIREFDTLKSKKVLQSLETGLFFCQIFIFSI